MRARIRDAAIELFGQEGFDRATVRGIADRAGASPALVLHHFGSRAGVRDACDEYVVLQSHLARGLGVDPLSPEGARVLAISGLELFTRGLYSDDSLLSAATEALGRGMGPRSDKGDGDPNQDPDPPMASTPSDPSL